MMHIILKQRCIPVRIFCVMKNISHSSSMYGDDIHDPIHPLSQGSSVAPAYVERQGEDTDVKRARLLYQSRKRGMLENGLLLSTFADRYLRTFDQRQLQLYDRLINLPSNDWDIFYWATGVKPVPAEFDHEVMNLLKKHVQNEDRKTRIRQPDL